MKHLEKRLKLEFIKVLVCPNMDDEIFPFLHHVPYSLTGMAIRAGEFSSGGIKLEIFLLKNHLAQRKFLNFENWTMRSLRVLKTLNFASY